MVIEHAFGPLVSRWRTLWKHLYMLDVIRMTETIYACCVLHNICLDVGDVQAADEDDNGDRYDDFVERDTRLPPPSLSIDDDVGNERAESEVRSVARTSNNRFDLIVNRYLDQLQEQGQNTRLRLLEDMVPRHLWQQDPRDQGARGRGRGRREGVRRRGERGGRVRGRSRRGTIG